jgi:hypothetical protein
MDMDLWIRSQDREDLLEVDNIGLAYKGKYGFMDKIGDINNYCICQFIDDYHVKLGTYKTKKRALEVLDEIQKTIINNEVIRIIMPNVKDMRGNEELYKENVFNTMVYEMPKE